ncbi:hypothetical protein VPH35_033003 [Triticum aestivum]
MDKYRIRIFALALLSLYLLCSATVAQCRIMDDTDGEKINLPNMLCTTPSWRHECAAKGICFCCLVNPWCYSTMEDCKRECKKSSSSEDILVAMTSSPTLPTP